VEKEKHRLAAIPLKDLRVELFSTFRIQHLGLKRSNFTLFVFCTEGLSFVYILSREYDFSSTFFVYEHCLKDHASSKKQDTYICVCFTWVCLCNMNLP